MLRRGVAAVAAAQLRAGAPAVPPATPTLARDARAFSALPLAVQTAAAARGPGGRHSISGLRVCVFGSTGFLGRYVVNAMGRMGSLLSLPTRGTDNDRQHLRVMGDLGQVVFWDAPHDMIRNDEAIRKAIGDANVVINLIGRDFETGHYRFADVNVDAARRIAAASADAGVTRLIHFSALGAAPDAPSAQLRTKAAGEAAVAAAFPGATIMRPAPMFGTEDRLLRTWAAMSKVLPAVPLIDGGKTRMAPVDVRDVAAAVKAAVLDEASAGRTYTLAGPQVFTVRELVDLVFHTIREPPRTLPVPAALAALAAKPREALQAVVPFPVPVLPAAMYTSDNVAGMAVDYVAPPGAPGFEELGITPRKAEGLNIDYLRAFRAGGYQHGELVGQGDN